jgi:ketosteroid isomerase-like protein
MLEREADLDVLRRFFRDDFGSEARRDLWAEDGIFEMPFAASGTMVFRGKQAIYARARISYAKFESFRFTNVQIIPTIEEGLYLVLCGSDAVVKATNTPVRESFVNLIRLRDGLVVHRVEYFNPLKHV